MLRDVISYRLLQADMTDWDFKDFVLQAVGSVNEIVVLPHYLRRGKQLLQEDEMRIGCVIDYPLGCGTFAKVAYEAAQAFQEGADFLEIRLSADHLLKKSEKLLELNETLRTFTLAGGEIRWSLTTEYMKEWTKIQAAQKIKALRFPFISLGESRDFEEAEHEVQLFLLDGGEQLTIQTNLVQPTVQEIAQLLAQGTGKIGIETIAGYQLNQVVTMT